VRRSSTSINRPPRSDRPELLDAACANGDVPVVEVDGRVAVAGDEADLVAEPEPVGSGRDGEAAVLVGGALVGRGRLVADERRARIECQRLQAGIDDRPVLRRLITVVHTNRLGSKALVGAPSRSRLRP